MEIRQVTDGAEKRRIARRVLEALPDWFSHVPAREEYIAQSVDKLFFCAYDSDRPIGFFIWERDGERYRRIVRHGCVAPISATRRRKAAGNGSETRISGERLFVSASKDGSDGQISGV